MLEKLADRQKIVRFIGRKQNLFFFICTFGSMVGTSFFLCNKCVRIGDAGEEEVVEDTVVVETGNEGNR